MGTTGQGATCARGAPGKQRPVGVELLQAGSVRAGPDGQGPPHQPSQGGDTWGTALVLPIVLQVALAEQCPGQGGGELEPSPAGAGTGIPGS